MCKTQSYNQSKEQNNENKGTDASKLFIQFGLYWPTYEGRVALWSTSNEYLQEIQKCYKKLTSRILKE
jgi:hypothetical protein